MDNVNCTLEQVCNGSDHVVLGDFNMPGVDWLTCVHKGSSAEADFCNFLNDMSFQQINAIPSNDKGNFLALVFTNQSEKLTPVDEHTGSFATDHTPLTLLVTLVMLIKLGSGDQNIVVRYVLRVKIRDTTAELWFGFDSKVRYAQKVKQTSWRKTKAKNTQSAWSKFRSLTWIPQTGK